MARGIVTHLWLIERRRVPQRSQARLTGFRRWHPSLRTTTIGRPAREANGGRYMSDGEVTSALVEIAAAGPSSDLPPSRGDERRRHLVEVTARLASRNGVVTTSVKDIARAAGVAPGLVHYYFTSKEELLGAVVVRLEAELRGVWRRGLDGYDDPLDRLVHAFDALADDAEEHPERRRLLADLAVLSLTSPQLHEHCNAMWRRLAGDIEVELRQVLGGLPAYTLASPRDLALVLAASIDGVVLQAMVCNESPRTALRTLVTVVLSIVAAAHVVAGQEAPLARLRELAHR